MQVVEIRSSYAIMVGKQDRNRKSGKVATPQNLAFGNRLKVWRVEAGLTQHELSAKWGPDQRSISGYEKGLATVEYRSLASLAAAIGKPAQEVADVWAECQRLPDAPPAEISEPEELQFRTKDGWKFTHDDIAPDMEFTDYQLALVDTLLNSFKPSKKRG